MKFFSVCSFIALSVAAWGFGVLPMPRDMAFSALVLDEATGKPAPGIPVRTFLSDVPSVWGGASVDRERYLVTDGKGMFHCSGSSNAARAGFRADVQAGYYAPPTWHFCATGFSDNVMSRKWEPYGEVVTVMLQRVEHPIPLKVKTAEILNDGRNGRPAFDGGDVELRYDLLAGDWLPPHGSGTTADLVFRATFRTNALVHVTSKIVAPCYDLVGEVLFPGDGNGLLAQTPPKTSGIKLRVAPESGYVPSAVVRTGRRKSIVGPNEYTKDYSESDPDRCYFLRVRTVKDEKGRIVSAHYGKIYGDFDFKVLARRGFGGVSFLYYLNPVPLDRNLEWDCRTNLFPDQAVAGPRRP